MILDQSRHYTHDSRRIKPGDGYICLPKGDAYIEDALQRGAVDVVHLTREAFAEAAHAYFDYPTKRVSLIGVTGTNGKTSVSYFVAQLLEQLGHKVLVIGTLNSALTTPESWDILDQIKAHADQGGTHVVLEVSSHGIDQKRVHGFEFDVKCLTNITHDHLDYHKTFENYKATKMHFMMDYPGLAIFADDVSQLSTEDIPQLKGSFHAKNVSAAVAICQSLGLPMERISQCLGYLKSPDGRFQSIHLGQPFDVVVDFAHTPDALDMVMKDALTLVGGNKDRLLVVFGCGGDRDVSKRPAMGRVAATYSNQIYLTADNSRSESTLDIIKDIQDGIDDLTKVKQIICDRFDALSTVIQQAKSGDVVLVAGKGHETYQYNDGYHFYFNDADVLSYEIIRQVRNQTNHSWVLNKPDADADVLFISKKLIPKLKITYSQFKRALPTPSIAKVREYVRKIKGEKILILETGDRLSLSHALLRMFCENSQAFLHQVDCEQTLEHQLVGLTLIEQTDAPLIIQVNPYQCQKLKKLVDVIAPNHIIVGDIYHQDRYIEPAIIQQITQLFGDKSTQFSLWTSNQMTDIKDAVPDEYVSSMHEIKSESWVHYLVEICKEMLIKTECYHDDPNALFQRYLLASQWYYKVRHDGQAGMMVVMNWLQDAVDMRQKVWFFKQQANPMVHHLKVHDFQALQLELEAWALSQDQQTIIPNGDQSDGIVSADDVDQSLHLIWKSPEAALTIIGAIK